MAQQIQDEDTLTRALDYCLEQELLTDSKADYIRDAWAKAQQQGDDREDHFRKLLIKNYGPTYPSQFDRFCKEYFNHVAASTKSVAPETPSSSANTNTNAASAPPTSQQIAEELQRQREEEIKKSPAYRSYEAVLRDCVARRKLSQREGDLFLLHLLKQGDEKQQIIKELGERMMDIAKIIKHSEFQMKYMAADYSMVQNIFAKINDGNEKLAVSPDTCVALCDGLQKHLKNVMESVIKLADGRYSTSTLVTHRDILSSMSSGEVSDPTMAKVAMKWGPSVGNLLADEDVDSRELYKRFRKDDEKKLEEKMKQVEESLAAIAGTKRKSATDGADLTWWKKDEVIEKEGKMSWQQLAECQMKLDLAKRVGSGPTISVAKRKEMQKKFQTEEEERKKLLESGENNGIIVPPSGGDAAILVDDGMDNRMDVDMPVAKKQLTPAELFQQQYELAFSRPAGKITKEDVVKVLEERNKIRLRK